MSTRPIPVVATSARWYAGPHENTCTVLSITNGRSRIFVAPDDLPALAQAVCEVMDAQEVAS